MELNRGISANEPNALQLGQSGSSFIKLCILLLLLFFIITLSCELGISQIGMLRDRKTHNTFQDEPRSRELAV